MCLTSHDKSQFTNFEFNNLFYKVLVVHSFMKVLKLKRKHEPEKTDDEEGERNHIHGI